MDAFVKPTNVLAFLFGISVLSGCGSESNTHNKDIVINTIWERQLSTTTLYASFNEDSIEIYRYFSEFECHSLLFEVSFSRIDNSTIHHLNGGVSHYQLTDDSLTIEPNETYNKSDINQLISCSDPTSNRTMQISLEFENLIDEIETDTTTVHWFSEFLVSINFDIDNSFSLTAEDLVIELWAESYPSDGNGLLNLNNLDARLAIEGEDDITYLVSRLEYKKEGNRFIFDIPLSNHKAFRSIDANTNINVFNYYESSDLGYQSDYLPAQDQYTQGISGEAMIDPQGDATGNLSSENTFIDITSIEIQFIED